jgi:Putative papain-like cysteine peptidase (DUF1796)/Domain of unknown function (DUF4214)
MNTEEFNKQTEACSLVDALYEAILGRKADVGGLNHHINLVKNLTHTEALRKLIPAMIGSKEFKTKYAKSVFSRALLPQNADSENTPINHLFSLGTRCYTSELLKQAGLKQYSGPFDWIFSSPEMIGHALVDDFKYFLDSQYYADRLGKKLAPSFDERTPIDHEFYKNEFLVKSMFNHHDPRTKEDYEYFARCVERFQSAVKSHKNVLLIVCTEHTHDMLNKFRGLCASLESIALENVHLRYFSIEPHNSLLPQTELVENHKQRFELHHYKSTSPWKVFNFDSLIDDLALFKLISHRMSFNLTKR